MYSEQCAKYSEHCNVYSEECTVYNEQCRVYSVQCIVHISVEPPSDDFLLCEDVKQLNPVLHTIV